MLRVMNHNDERSRFSRRVESFTCWQCKAAVAGDGYTNHCPHCLASLHVDEYPGDRAAECRGEMIAVGAYLKNGEVVLNLRCRRCGAVKPNRARPEDDRDLIVELLAAPAGRRRE